MLVKVDSLKSIGLNISEVKDMMDNELLDQSDELLSYYSSIGDAQADYFSEELERVGLKTGKDFFVFRGDFPDWLAFKVALQGNSCSIEPHLVRFEYGSFVFRKKALLKHSLSEERLIEIFGNKALDSNLDSTVFKPNPEKNPDEIFKLLSSHNLEFVDDFYELDVEIPDWLRLFVGKPWLC